MKRLPIAILLTVSLLTSVGCARSWPDEIPNHDGWQIRAAPMLKVHTDNGSIHSDGVMFAAFVYASNWTDHPRTASDPSLQYAVLPSRLDIVCIDVANSQRGTFDIMLRLSDTILRRWHPDNWASVSMIIRNKESKTDQIPLSIRSHIPYVDGQAAVADALAEFKRYALRSESQADITALFKEEGLPPLKISFPVGLESNGDVLQRLYERCGELW